MKNFKLPDLGEGLPEAEIVEWHIKVGDTVEVDQVLVSVETAKAIVEVPSPQAGTIAKLYGEPGDIIHTGEPLLAFEGQGDDTGTVVGELKSSGKGAQQDQFIVGAAPSSKRARANRATPGGRTLAERLGVSLEAIKGSGPGGLITTDDVHKQASHQKQLGDAEALRGIRRTMAKNMALSHAQVVPVLRDITHRSLKDLRQGLENLRDAVATRKIPPREMQGATITLSNFGTMTGQYANPVVIPPQVAIVGAGRIRDKVVPHNGTATIRRILPLSLTFDHRAATGGEASRFLGVLINALQKTG